MSKKHKRKLNQQKLNRTESNPSKTCQNKREHSPILTNSTFAVLGIALLVFSFTYLRPLPPKVQLNSNLGAQIEDIDAGAITVTSTCTWGTPYTFNLEAHITEDTSEGFVIDIRAKTQEAHGCINQETPPEGVYIKLDFTPHLSGKAIIFNTGESEGATVADHYPTDHIQIAEHCESDKNCDAKPENLPADPTQQLANIEPQRNPENRCSLTETAKPDTPEAKGSVSTTIVLHLPKSFSINHPADIGTTVSIFRIAVIPDCKNAAQSGPYFALALPNIQTSPSNHMNPTPVHDKLITFRPHPHLSVSQSIVDENGTAELWPNTINGKTQALNPNQPQSQHSPVIQYTSRSTANDYDRIQQILTIIATVLLGYSIPELLSLAIARLRKTNFRIGLLSKHFNRKA